MVSVNQAFEAFSQSLNLNPVEQEKVAAQQGALRVQLASHFGADTITFLTGSYGRHTAIRPLHDVDLFLVLSRSAWGHLYSAGPSACIGEVRAALRRAYGGSPFPSKQNRSVNITFTSGVGYDIVPAFEHPSLAEVYQIPDRERDAWIHSNPKTHAAHSTAANQKAWNMLKPLIKMVKHWNVRNGKPLRSFHLEMMACSAFSSAPASYATGVRDLLGYLKDAVLRRCPDPASVGANIDEGMAPAERQEISRKLAAAYAQAKSAIDQETWNPQGAHQTWRQLFGEVYG